MESSVAHKYYYVLATEYYLSITTVRKNEKKNGDVGIWTRGLLHAKQEIYHWATPPTDTILALPLIYTPNRHHKLSIPLSYTPNRHYKSSSTELHHQSTLQALYHWLRIVTTRALPLSQPTIDADTDIIIYCITNRPFPSQLRWCSDFFNSEIIFRYFK